MAVGPLVGEFCPIKKELQGKDHNIAEVCGVCLRVLFSEVLCVLERYFLNISKATTYIYLK